MGHNLHQNTARLCARVGVVALVACLPFLHTKKLHLQLASPCLEGIPHCNLPEETEAIPRYSRNCPWLTVRCSKDSAVKFAGRHIAARCKVAGQDRTGPGQARSKSCHLLGTSDQNNPQESRFRQNNPPSSRPDNCCDEKAHMSLVRETKK